MLTETVRIIPGQTVIANHLNYSSPAFSDAAIGGSQVPVRYDPTDLGITWAWANDRWMECESEYSILHGSSERKRQITSRKLGRDADTRRVIQTRPGINSVASSPTRPFQKHQYLQVR